MKIQLKKMQNAHLYTIQHTNKSRVSEPCDMKPNLVDQT